jgi:hypothetical protein
MFHLRSSTARDSVSNMITLAEIEAATDVLTASDQRKLMLYLAARLQAQGAPLPEMREPRVDWMAEDEAAMRRFSPNE